MRPRELDVCLDSCLEFDVRVLWSDRRNFVSLRNKRQFYWNRYLQSSCIMHHNKILDRSPWLPQAFTSHHYSIGALLSYAGIRRPCISDPLIEPIMALIYTTRLAYWTTHANEG